MAMATIRDSLDTYISELRCWKRFCELLGVSPLPATSQTVKRFIGIFRNGRSARKYVQAVRWAHDYLELDISAWDTRSLAQVLRGSEKLTGELRKAKGVRWDLLRRLVQFSIRFGRRMQAVIYVLAAAFLFRVPSELLPLLFDNLQQHSQVREITVEGRPALEISLLKRKNRPQGSVLVRACTCPRETLLCPVHALSLYVRSQGRLRQGKVFSVSCTGFTRQLREDLADLAVERPEDYSSQSFRRGTAQEMMSRPGARLADVLKAGEWSSASFMEYQNREEIDQMAILDLLCDEDDDEAPVVRRRPAKRSHKDGDIRAFLGRVG
jgi:hypothetical protein